MSSDFFFALARVTCGQLLRAAGIDRCSPSMLDAVTDLLVRHLTLLAESASKNASLSGRPDVVVQDVALAMEQIGLVRPRAVLDPYDLNPNNLAGFVAFIEWAQGPGPEEARRISRMPAPTLGPRAQLMAKKSGEPEPAESKAGKRPTGDEEWLAALMKKRMRVGQEARFKGSVLGNDEPDPDTKIAGGPAKIEELSSES